MKIGVDLDDIISDSYLPLITWHNRVFNTQLTEADLTTSHLATLFRCESQELLNRLRDFYQSEEYLNIKPDKEAAPSLQRLARSHTLDIITSRPNYVQEETEAWLDRYYPNIFSTVYFANPYLADAPEHRSKAEICKQTNIAVMIDDNWELLSACQDGCSQLILFDKPWNQGPIPERVYGLELGKKLK